MKLAKISENRIKKSKKIQGNSIQSEISKVKFTLINSAKTCAKRPCALRHILFDKFSITFLARKQERK